MTYKVKYVDNFLNEDFEKLKSGTKDEQELYNLIVKALSQLEINPFNSIRIKKKQIPKLYINKYGIDNLRMIKFDVEIIIYNSFK